MNLPGWPVRIQRSTLLAAQLTTIVIVNWNGKRFLPPLLQSLQPFVPAARILVVDNHSTDGSAEYLRQQTGISLIENRENVGFGRGANQGIEKCHTPYVLLLNADTVALPDSIERLQQFLEGNPAAAIVAPQLLFADGTLQPSCRKFPSVFRYAMFLSYLDYLIPTGYRISKADHSRQMKVEQPMGAVLMIRKSALDQLGSGFDPRYSLYMEEVDLCKRLHDSGWEIHFLPDAKFIHHAGGSTGQDWERSQTAYFENVVKYFQKHFPPSTLRSLRIALPPALLLRAFVLLVAGRFRQSRFYFKQAFRI